MPAKREVSREEGVCIIHVSGSHLLPHTTRTSGIFLPEYSQQRFTLLIPSRGILDHLSPKCLPQLNSASALHRRDPFTSPLPGLTFPLSRLTCPVHSDTLVSSLPLLHVTCHLFFASVALPSPSFFWPTLTFSSRSCTFFNIHFFTS